MTQFGENDPVGKSPGTAGAPPSTARFGGLAFGELSPLAMFVVFFAVAAVFLVFPHVYAGILHRTADSGAYFDIGSVSGLICYAVSVGFCLFWVRGSSRRGQSLRLAEETGRYSWFHGWEWFPVLIACEAIVAVYGASNPARLGEASEASFFQALASPFASITWLILAVNLVVLAPVLYQLIFWGIGLAGYRNTGSADRATFWCAALSVLMFRSTLFYGIPTNSFLADFLFGGYILSAYVRLRSGSLSSSIAANCLNNTIVLAIAAYLYKTYGLLI